MIKGNEASFCNNGFGRKRTRATAVWLVVAVVLLFPVVTNGLTITTSTPTTARSTTRSAPFTVTRPRMPSPYTVDADIYDDEDDEEDDDEDDNELFQVSIESFLQLRDSTGSEILQSDLQHQIDQSLSQPNTFFDAMDAAVTEMEKVAMSSITEQLPQRAVEAFRRNNDHHNNRLNYATTPRVTHHQEVALGRLIQKGSALQAQKTRLSEQWQRNPTNLEWADSVGLTTKELRRQISDYRIAKHHLVTANMGLVHAVVKQLWPSFRSTGVSRDELVQEGSLGLLRAAELFDPSRGLRFSTYAVVWIKGTLSNSHVPELVKLPGREKTKWNKIVRAQRDLEESGQDVTLEHIATMTDLPLEQIVATQRKMSRTQRMLSLDYQYNTQSRSGTETSSSSSSQFNPLEKDKALRTDQDLVERTQLHADLIAAMARNLDDREARLLRLRYGLSDGRARSLQECADAMGLSYTRVHQLAAQCLKKLRQAAEAESLEEYLLTIA